MSLHLDNPHLLFDRKLLHARQRRALAAGAETFLLDHVAKEFVERIATIKRQFQFACELEAPGGLDMLARRISAEGQYGPFRQQAASGEEAFGLESASIDFAVSALSLHWFNDLPGALAQIRRALKPDGLMLAAMLGGDTLTELRESFAAAELELEGGLSPRVAPFVEVRALGGLLQRAGFALPVTDVERLTIRYATPLHLMRELRGMGATNVLIERSRKPLRRKTLLRASEIYAERFADADGRIRATFDILWMSGWSPHESQQQPLKPGSAKTRLADALGVSERPAGEKTGPKKS